MLTVAAALLVGWWVARAAARSACPACVARCCGGTSAAPRTATSRENASYSRINASLTETVEGARTVEALGLGRPGSAQVDRDIAGSYAAERYTLYLRTRFFPTVEVASYLLPSVATLLFGGWLYIRGDRCRWATSPRPRSTCRCSSTPSTAS